jgi:hypothetical protein
MHRAGLLVLIIQFSAACHGGPADTDPADREQCEHLRSHVVDVRLADATGIDVRPHHEALEQALGEPFIADCMSTMTNAQVTCAIASTNLDAAASAACRGGSTN